MIKKLRYKFENFLYKKRYGKNVNIDDYKIMDNCFSGKKLNIIYLTYYDSTFNVNNVYKSLCEIGTVFRFEMTTTPHLKDWYLNKEDINSKMYRFVEDIISKHNIDVIVCYLSGHSTTPSVLERIKSFDIPVVNESLDDERKFISRKGKDGHYRGVKEICNYFDLSLTTSKSAIIKYLVEGAKPIYKDYSGNENVYKKLNLNKEFEVGFVGASNGVRSEYVNYLRKNGISVYTKGKGWNEGFADPDEMIEIFNKSKIVLGVSTIGKNDDIYHLKGRDFEVPLTGSFYLTGDHLELREYFDIGIDIETYTSKENLLEKVKYYLENEDEREKIALSGHIKCLENYTAKKSYEKVFGYLGL